jgi:hypothetical protein
MVVRLEGLQWARTRLSEEACGLEGGIGWHCTTCSSCALRRPEP